MSDAITVEKFIDALEVVGHDNEVINLRMRLSVWDEYMGNSDKLANALELVEQTRDLLLCDEDYEKCPTEKLRIAHELAWKLVSVTRKEETQ